MARRREATDKLAASLNATLQRTKNSGTWGVIVVSLTSGDTLFGHNADRQLLPASTMKLYTAALALDRFGANGRFETEVLRTGTLRPDGTLDGDLVLRGAGDPTLGGLPVNDAITSPMSVLARAVADAGIKRVSGALIGDASGFDDGKVRTAGASATCTPHTPRACRRSRSTRTRLSSSCVPMESEPRCRFDLP